MATYCGPRRAAREAELLEHQRRGWAWEEKADGVYVELTIGTRIADPAVPVRSDRRIDHRYRGATRRPGVIVQARYRSGAVVTLGEVLRARGAHRCADVLGIETPWQPGTRVVGELMVQTPRARAWQDTYGGLKGCVLFDVLAEGVEVGAREASDLAARGILPAQDWSLRPNVERRAALERMVGELGGGAARALSLVRRGTWNARGAYRDVVEAGGEGVVLVDPGAPAGRGKLKVKASDALDCRVVQILADEGVALVALGSLPPFRVSIPDCSIAVGDVVEVKFHGWYDDSLTPRHARIVRRRDDLAI